MNEEELMKVMQKFCWDNSIDYNTVNWGKFLRGENIPGYWENQSEVWTYFTGGCMTKELPDWKKKALSDPSVTDKQAKIIMEGPKCLTDAWFLQAMRYKYQIRGYEN